MFKANDKPKEYTCCKCGKHVRDKSMGVFTKKHKFVCFKCTGVNPYNTKNNNKKNVKTKIGLTYGFEFEAIPKVNKNEAIAEMVSYGFIPTRDGSISECGGIEFKSPIYQSLNNTKKMFEDCNRILSFFDDSLGQHIHIGHKDYDKDVVRNIRKRYFYLIRPLCIYMKNHREDTIRVCGRYFNTYCNQLCCSDNRHSFINVSGDNTIEYRISKFVTPQQYFELVNMWSEMTLKLIKFGKNNNATMDDINNTTDTLVNIFKKYANGEAWCQKQKV